MTPSRMPSISAVIRSPFLASTRVIVDLLIQHDAVDRAIQRHRLGMLELVVRFDLSDLRHRPDAERAKIAQCRSRCGCAGHDCPSRQSGAILSFALNELSFTGVSYVTSTPGE